MNSRQRSTEASGPKTGARTTEDVVAQVESLPELIRSEFAALDMRARRLLNHDECLSIRHIVITGCGDSYSAAAAARLAFTQLAGIPAEPMTAMQCGRYAAPYFDQRRRRNPLTIGISASGTVARTREAVTTARQQGALTVAVTGNNAAPLAAAADRVFDCTIPNASSPGVRTYRASLLALFLLAIHLAEVNGRLGPDEARDMRNQLRQTADVVEATIEAIRARTGELAAAVAHESSVVFTGDGPNYGTALFAAAKVIELTGRHALGQDTEEWAHLQYFVNVDKTAPTFVISPGGRGHGRAAELAHVMRRVGRTLIAVVPAGDEHIAPHAQWVLPVAGSLPEVFSPMAYPLAAELFSTYLSAAVGESPFRSGTAGYEPDGNMIRTADGPPASPEGPPDPPSPTPSSAARQPT